MGLLPPKPEQSEAGTGSVVRSEDTDEVGDDQEGDDEQGEESTPIGLIGHFEAQALMDHKGSTGPFVASLDMSMTEQDLISTQEGVGE